MVVVPLAASANDSETPANGGRRAECSHWLRVVSAGTLATSGVLLMAGKRRAALVTAVAGTALTILDQQDTVRSWWGRLPGYLEEVQSILTRAQGAVDELSAQGERLRNILSR